MTRSESVMKNRAVKSEAVAVYKSEKGCCICGLDEPVALDLHHINPEEKSDSIADLLAKGATLERIFNEIEKCVVICANHHRMFHAGLITIDL